MMKRSQFLVPLLALGLLIYSACTPQGPTVSPVAETYAGNISSTAAAQVVVDRFLKAWAGEDYGGMFALLSSLSQDAFSQEDFTQAYQDAANALTLESLSYQTLSALAGERQAEVAFRVTFSTRLLGDISRENVAYLSLEGSGLSLIHI